MKTKEAPKTKEATKDGNLSPFLDDLPRQEESKLSACLGLRRMHPTKHSVLQICPRDHAHSARCLHVAMQSSDVMPSAGTCVFFVAYAPQEGVHSAPKAKKDDKHGIDQGKCYGRPFL